ncbi:MAG: precorrin-6y C5,15-methyltransferase (decarboxylating) subunit CbiE [Geminicoccaceae bacterium]
MTASWLTVVGIGADGLPSLGARARSALDAAEVIVGGARHLAMVEGLGKPTLAWRSPLTDTLPEILAHRPKPVAVLATGDPLWYGIARLLLRHLPMSEIHIVPHVAAFQEACARLGWPLEGTTPLSLHGRSPETLRRHLQPGRRLLALTSDGTGPAAIAGMLREVGLGRSPMTVLENLAGADERAMSAPAADFPAARSADLNLVAIETVADAATPLLPQVPGLPDDAFDHDGQLTKAEVRAITVARLVPLPGQTLWDVGAGAGSVAIEWLRATTDGRAYAIERDSTRAARIRANAAALGTPELTLVEGTAPACLASLPRPDAIFLGGGVGEPGLLEACWSALAAGGRLVANAVTLGGEAALLAFHGRHGGSLTRLAISRAEPVGGEIAWRPALPVTQLVLRKSCVAAS